MRYHNITENRQPGKIEKGRVFISLLRKVASNQRIIQKLRSGYSISFVSFLFFDPLFPLFPLFIFIFILFLFFLVSFFPSSFPFASETY